MEKKENHGCPVCFRAFPDIQKMLLHVQHHSAENCFLCFYCCISFQARSGLIEHYLNAHPDSDELCIPSPERQVNKAGSLQCHICHEKFSHHRALNLHIGLEHARSSKKPSKKKKQKILKSVSVRQAQEECKTVARNDPLNSAGPKHRKKECKLSSPSKKSEQKVVKSSNVKYMLDENRPCIENREGNKSVTPLYTPARVFDITSRVSGNGVAKEIVVEPAKSTTQRKSKAKRVNPVTKSKIQGPMPDEKLAALVNGKTQCTVCKRFFVLVRSYNNHTCPRKCSICGKLYSSEASRSWHFLNEHKGNVMCLTCNTVLPSYSSYVRHWKREHRGNTVLKRRGNFKWVVGNEGKIISSNRGKRQRSTNQCSICGRVFSLLKGLCVHKGIAHGPVETCTICKKPFSVRTEFNDHNVQIHDGHADLAPVPESKESCNLCSEIFTNPFHLEEHINVIHGSKNKNIFKCPHCVSTFTQKSHFDVHKNAIHGGAYRCSACSVISKNKKYFWYHNAKFHSREATGISLEHSIENELTTEGMGEAVNTCAYEEQGVTSSNSDEGQTEDPACFNSRVYSPGARKDLKPDSKILGKGGNVKARENGSTQGLVLKGRSRSQDGRGIGERSFGSETLKKGAQKIKEMRREIGRAKENRKFASEKGDWDEKEMEEKQGCNIGKLQNKKRKSMDTESSKSGAEKIPKMAERNGRANINHSPYQCMICGRIFCSFEKLRIHKVRIHGAPIKCMSCEKTFSCAGHFKIHSTKVHNELAEFKEVPSSKVICPFCPEIFRYPFHLEEHLRLVHENLGKFKCKLCVSTFNRGNDLNSHVRHWHNQVSCSKCSVVFDGRSRLESHTCAFDSAEGNELELPCNDEATNDDIEEEETPKNDDPNECISESLPDSGSTSSLSIKDAARSEMEKERGKKKRGKPAGTRERSKCAAKRIHGGETSKNVKRQTSESEKRVTKRTGSPTGPPRYQCRVCGRIFAVLDSLWRHTAILHDGMVQCKVCQKAFSSVNRFNVHNSNSHDARGEYEKLQTSILSCIHCREGFKNFYHLREHVKFFHSKTTPKVFKCPVCVCTFFRSRLWLSHLTECHGKVRCSECSEVLENKKKFYYHKQLAHDGKGTWIVVENDIEHEHVQDVSGQMAAVETDTDSATDVRVTLSRRSVGTAPRKMRKFDEEKTEARRKSVEDQRMSEKQKSESFDRGEDDDGQEEEHLRNIKICDRTENSEKTRKGGKGRYKKIVIRADSSEELEEEEVNLSSRLQKQTNSLDSPGNEVPSPPAKRLAKSRRTFQKKTSPRAKKQDINGYSLQDTVTSQLRLPGNSSGLHAKNCNSSPRAKRSEAVKKRPSNKILAGDAEPLSGSESESEAPVDVSAKDAKRKSCQDSRVNLDGRKLCILDESFKFRSVHEIKRLALDSEFEAHPGCEPCTALLIALKVYKPSKKLIPAKTVNCPICFQHFETKNAYYRHKGKEHPDVGFVCVNCGQSFEQKSALIAHLKEEQLAMKEANINGYLDLLGNTDFLEEPGSVSPVSMAPECGQVARADPIEMLPRIVSYSSLQIKEEDEDLIHQKDPSDILNSLMVKIEEPENLSLPRTEAAPTMLEDTLDVGGTSGRDLSSLQNPEVIDLCDSDIESPECEREAGKDHRGATVESCRVVGLGDRGLDYRGIIEQKGGVLLSEAPEQRHSQRNTFEQQEKTQLNHYARHGTARNFIMQPTCPNAVICSRPSTYPQLNASPGRGRGHRFNAVNPSRPFFMGFDSVSPIKSGDGIPRYRVSENVCSTGSPSKISVPVVGHYLITGEDGVPPGVFTLSTTSNYTTSGVEDSVNQEGNQSDQLSESSTSSSSVDPKTASSLRHFRKKSSTTTRTNESKEIVDQTMLQPVDTQGRPSHLSGLASHPNGLQATQSTLQSVLSNVDNLGSSSAIETVVINNERPGEALTAEGSASSSSNASIDFNGEADRLGQCLAAQTTQAGVLSGNPGVARPRAMKIGNEGIALQVNRIADSGLTIHEKSAFTVLSRSPHRSRSIDPHPGLSHGTVTNLSTTSSSAESVDRAHSVETLTVCGDPLALCPPVPFRQTQEFTVIPGSLDVARASSALQAPQVGQLCDQNQAPPGSCRTLPSAINFAGYLLPQQVRSGMNHGLPTANVLTGPAFPHQPLREESETAQPICDLPAAERPPIGATPGMKLPSNHAAVFPTCDNITYLHEQSRGVDSNPVDLTVVKREQSIVIPVMAPLSVHDDDDEIQVIDVKPAVKECFRKPGDTKVFECELCGQQCRDGVRLRFHMKNMHSSQ